MNFSCFSSSAGRALLEKKFAHFGNIIKRFEDIYGMRPFNQQTAQSLLELWALSIAIRPKTIVEIGAGSRSSTIALALAAAEIPECVVRSIDIAQRDFDVFARSNFPDLRFARVEDIVAEASSFEIPEEWPRPLFMLYDAHDGDLEGKIISRQAIDRWFPKLGGQTIAIHDCSVWASADAGICVPPHVKAIHWSGRPVVGYAEVIPLIDWMNRERIDFWRPGDELAELGLPGEDSSLIALKISASA